MVTRKGYLRKMARSLFAKWKIFGLFQELLFPHTMKSVDKIDPLYLPYAAIYPRQYVALRAPPPPPQHSSSSSSSSSSFDESSGSLPAATTATTIDGDLDKPFWTDVDWTDDFVDIATDTSPGFRTKAKMRWDDEFLYVGGWMCVPSCCFRGVLRCFSRSTSLSHSIIFISVESDPSVQAHTW
jgi:hypothetical protein